MFVRYVKEKQIMANNVIKCVHCGKIYFDISEDKCPHCGKTSTDLPEIFNEIFGDKK